MRSRFAFLVLPVVVLLASVAPPALVAQAPATDQEVSRQPSPASPADPQGNRPADSRSGSPYLQVPDFLRNLQPVVPPPPREGAPSAAVGETIEYDRQTKQTRIIPASASPARELAPGEM